MDYCRVVVIKTAKGKRREGSTCKNICIHISHVVVFLSFHQIRKKNILDLSKQFEDLWTVFDENRRGEYKHPQITADNMTFDMQEWEVFRSLAVTAQIKCVDNVWLKASTESDKKTLQRDHLLNSWVKMSKPDKYK